jgi:hypothetical protein
VLATGLIAGDLQAHRGVARVAEQPQSPTPTSAVGGDETRELGHEAGPLILS